MTDYRKNRPQREIYTPGSGPLPRRGGQDDNMRQADGLSSNFNHSSSSSDKSADIYKITEKVNQISINSSSLTDSDNADTSKKTKKPDYAIYVPKRVAEAHANRGKEKEIHIEPKPPDVPPNPLGYSERKHHDKSKKKKKKNKNLNSESIKEGEKPLVNLHLYKSRESLHSDDFTSNRFSRQTSEPRSLPPMPQDTRLRDLRSTDTSKFQIPDKSRSKPPLGKRGSFNKGNSSIQFENLPPRLQKKYIAENGMPDSDRMPHRSSVNESWDGSSVTFKGKYGPIHDRPVSSVEYSGPKSYPEWSKTLPCAGRAKGRGRLREAFEPPRLTRSLTPETVQTGQFDNVCEEPERNGLGLSAQSLDIESDGTGWRSSGQPRDSVRDVPQHSNYQPDSLKSSDVDKHTDTSDAENILDWAAEVERCEQEEDTHQPFYRLPPPSFARPRPSPPSRDDGKKRKNRIKPKESKERSVSQEKLGNSFCLGPTENAYKRNGSAERTRGGGTGSRRTSEAGGPPPRGASQSRKGSYAENRTNRQGSIEKWENFINRSPRSRQNSLSDNRSRQSSAERGTGGDGGGGRRRGGGGPGGGGRKSRREGRRGDGEAGGASGKATPTTPTTAAPTANWRLEQEILARERNDKLMSPGSGGGGKTAGILVLPQPIKEPHAAPTSPRKAPPAPTAAPHHHHHYHPPGGPQVTSPQARKLYDPSNPDRYIMVPSNRPQFEDDNKNSPSTGYYPDMPQILGAAASEQMTSKPVWYNPYTENFQVSHNPQLIRAIEQADCELQYLLSTCELLKYWERMQLLRTFLKEALSCLLVTDLRFCEIENVEQHFWKILYYNVIELLRKLMSADHQQQQQRQQTQGAATGAEGGGARESYRLALLAVIQEGCEYYEQLLKDIENHHKIKLEEFLLMPPLMRENLKYAALPLVAAQKIFLCLGDLARYREQANETSNYGLARQWYLKANQINPKNGRPYNQLAILALYTKRKLDAVYYYTRCLMSSNPISAARESLVTLFDENRKKYESTDRKRKEEKMKKERERMKEKEGGGGGSGGGGIRRETWVHPAGGRRNMHRTTSTSGAAPAVDYDSEDEELYAASDIEVNKRFVTSYLHVHGKIFTKIGLESLSETGVQMLKQFRALLRHSPLPLNSHRFLQLLALNMFSIEVSQPKDSGGGAGGMVLNVERDGCYRSATQESALVISLQMFNLLLERFVCVLEAHRNSSSSSPQLRAPLPPSSGSSCLPLPPDCLEMLPALKVWCDWLMTHVEIWNPPPSIQDYKVGPGGDCWSRMATLINLLEKVDYRSDILSADERPDCDIVYLPEDATLSGFTPLMANINELKFKPKDVDLEVAQVSLRLHKILYLGTVFLCGLDPPVLKLQKVETAQSEYISVVGSENTQEQILLDEDVETWSESDDDSSGQRGQRGRGGSREGDDDGDAEGSAGSELAARRRQLQLQAKSRTVQMARITNALTEMEVRPHDLVPDTNCFIECLPALENILKVLPHPHHPYVLMVPLVVVNELEGLSKGCKPSQSAHHSALVRETAKAAMALLQVRHPALRTCTTLGHPLASAAFTFEEDSDAEMTNDDKILTTCMNLCKTFHKDEIKEGGKRKLYREVVLLTEDRNLALKAMARDMPVRSLPDFIRWAGLG